MQIGDSSVADVKPLCKDAPSSNTISFTPWPASICNPIVADSFAAECQLGPSIVLYSDVLQRLPHTRSSPACHSKGGHEHDIDRASAARMSAALDV
eukprot:4687635-Prymnesium_polylepis.1